MAAKKQLTMVTANVRFHYIDYSSACHDKVKIKRKQAIKADEGRHKSLLSLLSHHHQFS